jgi:hypothetical protein
MGSRLSIDCQVQPGVFCNGSSFVWSSIHIKNLNRVFQFLCFNFLVSDEILIDECPSASVQDRGPTWLMMSKGPRYFSESFFEGRVVQKNFAFTKALSPTLNSEGGIRFLSADC